MTRTFSPALRIAAIDGVTADAERLDESELIESQPLRWVQFAGRQDEARPQAAVGVDAEDLQIFAAVDAAAPAGEAALTVHVRLDGTTVAGLDVGHIGADLQHFDAEFMSGDARIAVERHLAEIAADVGAANADAVDAHQRFAGAGFFRLVDGDLLESPRFLQQYRLHPLSPISTPSSERRGLSPPVGRRENPQLAFSQELAFYETGFLWRRLPAPLYVNPIAAIVYERTPHMKSSTTYRTFTVLFLALSVVGLVAAEKPKPAHPNIIFILADDLGYGDLGCYGQKRILTPNLDRMAAEGMRFTQFYAGDTVCAPSRCTLMTGLHTGHAIIRGNARVPLRPQDVTVAEVLKGAGYRDGPRRQMGPGRSRHDRRPQPPGVRLFLRLSQSSQCA